MRKENSSCHGHTKNPFEFHCKFSKYNSHISFIFMFQNICLPFIHSSGSILDGRSFTVFLLIAIRSSKLICSSLTSPLHLLISWCCKSWSCSLLMTQKHLLRPICFILFSLMFSLCKSLNQTKNHSFLFLLHDS